MNLTTKMAGQLLWVADDLFLNIAAFPILAQLMMLFSFYHCYVDNTDFIQNRHRLYYK